MRVVDTAATLVLAICGKCGKKLGGGFGGGAGQPLGKAMRQRLKGTKGKRAPCGTLRPNALISAFKAWWHGAIRRSRGRLCW